MNPAIKDARALRVCNAIVTRFRDAELFRRRDGSAVSITDGYIPLLVNYTREDQAAKGLRSLREPQSAPSPPIYFSALEIVQATRAQLLFGPHGAGKTSFALHLALHLAGTCIGAFRFAIDKLEHDVPRNDLGESAIESWDARPAVPLFVETRPVESFDAILATIDADERELLDSGAPGADILLILDNVERLGAHGPVILNEALAFAARRPYLRILALGAGSEVASWPPPPGLAKHETLPLLPAQRRSVVDASAAALSDAAALPGLFGLSLDLPTTPSSAENLVDLWTAAACQGLDVSAIEEAAFSALRDDSGVSFDSHLREALFARGLLATLDKRFLVERLAARHLAKRPPTEVAALFHDDPNRWNTPVASLASRLDAPDRLVDALLAADDDGGARGALLAAHLVEENAPQRPLIAGRLVRMIEEGALDPARRESAARILARWGDPRELEAFAFIPGGVFTMGSTAHPNSTPPHIVSVAPFRIGLYPVSNGAYGAFIAATERAWRSRDGRRPERANAPAVDLTWRDAVAYCKWLTARWRAEGRIGSDECVRLPTEPEWERAARGDQPDRSDEIVYPWAGGWRTDAANSEETGFNNTCAVGLFPSGRSPYGCYDMAGQVWEWTSTLWGEDMTTPSFRYPYADDGREAQDAGPTIRRVLRGGCFSGGAAKACCHYRGSLEPDGFWRGNGFRIVLAPSVPAR